MDVPGWLTAIAWVSITLSVACAALVAYDVFGRGHRQTTLAMDLVWPVAALYLGPVAPLLHRRWGRPRTTPRAVATGLAGGAASTVAHFVGVPLVVLAGIQIAGIDLWPMILVIAVIATAVLATLEVSAGRPVLRAASLAFLTVLAFDVGMGGWMLLLHFTDNMPAASHIAFWLLMQVGVVLGTLTALPAVGWLVRPERPVPAT